MSIAGDVLPFAVDSRFIASGYEGDYRNIVQLPTCAGGRAIAGALGQCWTATYRAPIPAVAGFAGVAWQYPANNFGATTGYKIPAGANNVLLYAKGAVGGEVVSFGFGGVTPSVTSACADSVANSVMETLTTTWTQYTIPLNGQTYANGEIFGFVWITTPPAPSADGGATDAAAASDAGASDAGATLPPVQFFIDDIRWSM